MNALAYNSKMPLLPNHWREMCIVTKLHTFKLQTSMAHDIYVNLLTTGKQVRIK